MFYSQPGKILFPGWEQIIPFKGSVVTNKAAFFILTARVTRLNLKKTPIRLVVWKIMPKFAAFYNYWHNIILRNIITNKTLYSYEKIYFFN